MTTLSPLDRFRFAARAAHPSFPVGLSTQACAEAQLALDAMPVSSLRQQDLTDLLRSAFQAGNPALISGVLDWAQRQSEAFFSITNPPSHRPSSSTDSTIILTGGIWNGAPNADAARLWLMATRKDPRKAFAGLAALLCSYGRTPVPNRDALILSLLMLDDPDLWHPADQGASIERLLRMRLKGEHRPGGAVLAALDSRLMAQATPERIMRIYGIEPNYYGFLALAMLVPTGTRIQAALTYGVGSVRMHSLHAAASLVHRMPKPAAIAEAFATAEGQEAIISALRLLAREGREKKPAFHPDQLNSPEVAAKRAERARKRAERIAQEAASSQ